MGIKNWFIITTFLLVSFFLLSSKSEVYSQTGFLINSEVLYEMQTDGLVSVNQKISIENQVAEVFVKSYSLSLKSVVPQNVEVKEGEISYHFSLKEEKDKYFIEINFPDSRVGKGNKREFEVNYQTKSLTKKIGEIWEFSIPKLPEDNIFNNYRVKLKIPSSLGKLTYFSEEPASVFESGEYLLIEFGKESINRETVFLGFGNFQIFSFNLRYNLENPLERDAKIKIAIPPDSFYQRVFYESINPQPQKIEVDNDGNWLASFKMSPRERLIVIVKGYAQIFPEPYPLYQPTKESLIANSKPDKYWESDDPEIKNLAHTLKSVEDVYRFVVEKLSYDYNRTTGKTERFGAKSALKRRDEAVCTEFTDLFVALLRAKGIPAREVNGYALSDDPKIKPLSLTKDVLHAWPEYWDEKRKVWVAVDPTWEKTTGGIDYFRSSDLKHFSFVFHGESSTQPLSPGSYKFGAEPSKDVFVTLGGKPEFINNNLEVDTKIVSVIPLIKYRLIVNIYNKGQSAIYNDKLKILFDGKKYYEENIESLLPFSNNRLELSIPFSLFGKNSPNDIFIIYHNLSKDVKGVKKQMVIGSVLLFFSVVSFVLIYFIFRFRSLKYFLQFIRDEKLSN